MFKVLSVFLRAFDLRSINGPTDNGPFNGLKNLCPTLQHRYGDAAYQTFYNRKLCSSIISSIGCSPIPFW